jgi:NADPH-dependent glutamate synthase beta subunit-like oxidoreductase
MIIRSWGAFHYEITDVAASPGASPAPVGQEAMFTGTDTLRIADGKLAEYWANADSRPRRARVRPHRERPSRPGNPTVGRALSRPPLPLETSMPGVFAAGDVRHASVKRVASAVGEGSIATTQINQYLQAQTANS